jgi:glutathione synthase/RimK-type ligase-like ATP-grasp enzyme
MEAMNLVAALWVKKNAVRSAFRATHHQGEAVVKPPSGETGDSLVTYGTVSVLLTPEKATSSRTSK